MPVKKLVAFIVFSSVSCIVAAACALWEHVRRLVHTISFADQSNNKRYNDT